MSTASFPVRPSLPPLHIHIYELAHGTHTLLLCFSPYHGYLPATTFCLPGPGYLAHHSLYGQFTHGRTGPVPSQQHICPTYPHLPVGRDAMPWECHHMACYTAFFCPTGGSQFPQFCRLPLTALPPATAPPTQFTYLPAACPMVSHIPIWPDILPPSRKPVFF